MSDIKNRCSDYMGDVCMNGSCPMWQREQKHRIKSCDDCHFKRSCDDCYFYKDNQCIVNELPFK